MPTCFVIQPFDKGPFDKRYDDVFDPAIRAADLEPYRVDRDPRVSIPIEQIENGIRDARACLADITLDNPNVWFELGFAIAAKKEVVMACATSRERFPFDIQHRSIVRYRTESPSDFEELGNLITKRLRAILDKETKLETAASVSSPIALVQGLTSHEMVALVAVAENISDPRDGVSMYQVQKDMERVGFRKIAANLGLAALLQKGLINTDDFFDERAEEQYVGYTLTESGTAWLMANQDKLKLTD